MSAFPTVRSPIEIWKWGNSGPEKICNDQLCRNTSHPVARELHATLLAVQEFFLQEFKHFGLDGEGKMVPAEIEWDEKNARWICQSQNCKLQFHNKYALDPAVVAHEYTHGVIATSYPLQYYKESGALNESVADVMGITFRYFATGVLSWKIADRNLSHYASMDYFVVTERDSGGVHTNSKIPNHAFYLAATSVEKVSLVAKIWFTALKNCSETASFKEFAAKTVEIANTQSRKIALKILQAWVHVNVLNVKVEAIQFVDPRTGIPTIRRIYKYN